VPAVSEGVEVLLLVEDPGAANYVAPLPAAFARCGWRNRLLAAGKAAEQLDALGIAFVPVPTGASAMQLLATHRPSVVLVGTSENPYAVGLDLVRQAQAQNRATVGVVDGPASAPYRFRGGGESPLASAPDWILVPDEAQRRVFVELGHPAAHVIACGHPHYDRVREEREQLTATGREGLRRKLFPQATPNRPVVVFVAEQSDGLESAQFERRADYTLTGRGMSDRRTDIVLDEFLDAVSVLEESPYVVLRLHPKNTCQEFVRYSSEIGSMSRGNSALEVVFAADLVVGMTSILLLEAALLGRPTLSILPRAAERAWLGTIAAGFTRCALSRTEVRQALSDSLARPQEVETAAVDRAFPAGATDRIVSVFARLLGGEPPSGQAPTTRGL
jgi:hypothetical protein